MIQLVSLTIHFSPDDSGRNEPCLCPMPDARCPMPGDVLPG